MKRVFSVAVVTCILFCAAWVSAQSLELSVQSRQIYADVPFVLQVTASGFEESPAPELSELVIDGAKVVFQGMSPSVMSRRSVVNGRISSSREVRFIYSFRVEPGRAGNYQIPVITATQDGVTATSQISRFKASAVNDSRDMEIEMKVPQRPVWIGESFEIGISWSLRANPRGQVFVIPLFDHPAFEVEAPDTKTRERLGFQARGREIELPYKSEEVVEAGVQYTRFAFTAVATPTEAGRFELEAPRVVAELQTGSGRDTFGFRSARYKRFKATGSKQSFEVKPLPLSGRPASFTNAVGTGFSIQVTTSRSVVSVGEPIELTVVLGGERGLEGLGLPSMIGEGRLDKKLFDSIGDQATGKMAEDGKTKTFKVTVVLTSAEAREIPAIEFSFFDPEDASYKTVRSQPIAINVDGAAMVGAQDVVSSGRDPGTRPTASSGAKSSTAFAGDLTPSSGARTLREVSSLASIAPLLYGLYLVPFFLFVGVLWFRRTGAARGRSGTLRVALKRVQDAAKAAKSEAAEASAGELLNSMRDLAKATGNSVGSWRSEVEGLGFDPSRRNNPVASALVEAALAEATLWCKVDGAKSKSSKASASLVLLLALGVTQVAHADKVDEARASYATSLDTSERGQRTRSFEATKALYAALVEEIPERPELLADWGNAALGAGDLGTAALAYRKALALDKGLERAQKNLQWIRQQMPEHLVPGAGAVDSLFFWHSDWSLAKRHLVAAISFALFLLLVTPWGFRYKASLKRLAVVPFLLFVATLGSALFEPSHVGEAVLVNDGETLYSADSVGAPTALSAPLSAGLEVSMRERRGRWTQVQLADGTTGWLATAAVKAVN